MKLMFHPISNAECNLNVVVNNNTMQDKANAGRQMMSYCTGRRSMQMRKTYQGGFSRFRAGGR